MKVYIDNPYDQTLLGTFKKQTFGNHGSCANKLVFHNSNSKWFFKLFEEDINDLQVGDVFTSFIYKQLGLPKTDFVEYRFASFEGKGEDGFGVICPYFVPNDAKVIGAWEIKLKNYAKQFGWDLSSYNSDEMVQSITDDKMEKLIDIEFSKSGEYRSSVESIISDLEIYAQNNNLSVDIKDISFKLKRMIILDYFLVQKDRHMANIEFLIKDNQITLAPIFDNEYAFGMDHKEFYKETFASDRKRFRLRTGLTTAGGSIKEYRTNKIFRYGGIVAVDILDEIKHDKRLKNVVDRCLSLDINRCIDLFEKEIYDLTQEQEALIKNEFLKRRQQFYSTIALLKKKTGRKDIFQFNKQPEKSQ